MAKQWFLFPGRGGGGGLNVEMYWFTFSNFHVELYLTWKYEISKYLNPWSLNTGWPRKNETLSINNFKKTRNRMKTIDSVAVFLRQCHFQDLPSQKSQFTYRICSIVWHPRVNCQLLLCKSKPAWIKRSIHYVTMQRSNPGGATHRKSSLLQTWLLVQRSKFENYIASENGSRIKIINLGVILLEKECSSHECTN